MSIGLVLKLLLLYVEIKNRFSVSSRAVRQATGIHLGARNKSIGNAESICMQY